MARPLDSTPATLKVATAQIIDADQTTEALVREVLADVGCIDIVSLSNRAWLPAVDSARAALHVVCVQAGNLGPLRRIVADEPDTPVVAVCDEDDLDLVCAAGVQQCATRPLRPRELVGRVRDALRLRTVARTREHRERRMSDAIVALTREKQDLERLVCVDALTGIANRRHALGMLAAEWKRAAREHLPLAVIMIDLDCFHAYNERYGHLGGDSCLQRVADAMVRCLRRPSDYLGRYGGEEFIAVLPNTDSVGAKIVAERLRSAVEGLAIPHEGSTCARVVTCTVGFAAIKVLASDVMEKLIAAADAGLLEAKAAGRNRVGGVAPLVRPARTSAQRWERYPPVFADPWFADRIPPYLETLRHEVRVLVETSREGERRSGLPLARLRQTADNLGLTAVSLLLRDLESEVRDGDIAPLRRVADELLQYISHVQVVYRRTEDARSVA